MAREEEIGRRAVARDRHVVNDGDPKQGFHIHVVRMGRQRIPEKDDEIDAPFGDAGADLLVAPERPAAEPVDRQAEPARP